LWAESRDLNKKETAKRALFESPRALQAVGRVSQKPVCVVAAAASAPLEVGNVQVMKTEDVSFRLISQHPSDSDVLPQSRAAAPVRGGTAGTPVRSVLVGQQDGRLRT
jgi:hypothetical protein